MNHSAPTPTSADHPPKRDLSRVENDLDSIECELIALLDDSRRRFAANPHLTPLHDRTAEFVLRGGKRIRPRLCLSAYRILSGEASVSRPVVRAAACLELFHAFMLVHDDLIDRSQTRRGRPTLHEALRIDGGGARDASTAASLGLLGGDLLLALGMRLLGRSGLKPKVAARVQRLVADMLIETGLGEALDVLYDGCSLEEITEDQIAEAYIRKTSRYSVSGPLVLGATMAGAGPAVCRALTRFGDGLGLGYQIRNDLEGLAADPSEECSDLDGGKRTIVLWLTYHRLDERGRVALGDALTMPVGSERRRRLLDLIDRSGAVDSCRERLQRTRREALAALRHPALMPSQRRAFAELLGWIVRSQSPRAMTLPAVPDATLSGAVSPLPFEYVTGATA